MDNVVTSFNGIQCPFQQVVSYKMYTMVNCYTDV